MSMAKTRHGIICRTIQIILCLEPGIKMKSFGSSFFTNFYTLPPFCSSVLKPRLHLSIGHLERLGEGRPLGRGEVLLAVKPFLQLNNLETGEGSTRLLTLRRRPVLIWMTNTSSNYNLQYSNNYTQFNTQSKL